MELWRKKKRKNFAKKESSLETVPAKLRESFQPKMAVVSQACRFVPDTFSETIRHRWFSGSLMQWLFGVSGSAISTTCAIVGRCSPPKNWIKIGSS